MSAQIVNRKSKIVNGSWLPDMDLNHDKVIQSHLCYRYTIGQDEALRKLNTFHFQSSRAFGSRSTFHVSRN
jgi:hypothetical protein